MKSESISRTCQRAAVLQGRPDAGDRRELSVSGPTGCEGKLLALECQDRDRHAIANRIRDSKLPRMKTLEEFDVAQAPQIPAAKICELADGGTLKVTSLWALIGECGHR